MLFQAGKQESLRLDDRRKSDGVEPALPLLLTVFDSASLYCNFTLFAQKYE